MEGYEFIAKFTVCHNGSYVLPKGCPVNLGNVSDYCPYAWGEPEFKEWVQWAINALVDYSG